MSIWEIKKSSSVIEAAKLCDEMGREEFLKKYGYGPAREYVLVIDGRTYDSKAIAGVALGIEFPDKGPLKSSEFSGGEQTVRKKLQQLGFIVRRNSDVPLVLAENEVTFGGRYDHWQDVTGERYQFPNQYRNLILPGRPFVYYRGGRRKSGPRHVPEYFGCGVIGQIWRDPLVPDTAPRRNWKWFCEIEDYQEFKKPVPFKVDGQYLEQITNNSFRVGVRKISQACYEHILHEGSALTRGLLVTGTPPSMPSLDEIRIKEADANHPLVVSFVKSTKPYAGGQDEKAINGTGQRRRSVFSKIIGGRAEEIAFKHLSQTLGADERETLQSVADENYGWDIEYCDRTSQRIMIEVKGTSGQAFPNVEFTTNEWDAAQKYRSNFWLYLVSKCISATPEIQKVNDPYGICLAGELEAQPLLWRLRWIQNKG